MSKKIWIDFNDVDERGFVRTLLDFAEVGAKISVGDDVVVGDREGNRASGAVHSVDSNGLVTISVDMKSFVATTGRSDSLV